VQKANCCEPSHPKDDFVKVLNIHNAENKNELVENKVPEFILHVLKREED
jgi:hypothetical protein